MLLAKKFIEKQIISLDEGRIVGAVKDFYLDETLEHIVGIYLGSEGLLSRKPKLIKQETIRLYGIDVLFVLNSGIVVEGDELNDIENLESWIRRDDVIKREVQSPTGEVVGKIEDIMFDEMGQVIGFALAKVQIKGLVAENQAIRRDVVIGVGQEKEPMVIDLVKAEQQKWSFQDK
jgi:uncharacterized protein YrrD